MNEIHPTAIVDPTVRIGTGNFVGAYAILTGNLEIGNDNWIGPHAVIGTAAEHKSRSPLDLNGQVRIGHQNVIREFVTVQGGFEAATIISNKVWLQDKAHVGHDCVISDEATVSCAVMLGGHTHVCRGANIGLAAATHQRTVIGVGAMVGMGSIVQRHVPPYCTTIGNPSRVVGVNEIGLVRQGWDRGTIVLVGEVIAGKATPSSLPPDLAGSFFDFQSLTTN